MFTSGSALLVSKSKTDTDAFAIVQIQSSLNQLTCGFNLLVKEPQIWVASSELEAVIKML